MIQTYEIIYGVFSESFLKLLTIAADTSVETCFFQKVYFENPFSLFHSFVTLSNVQPTCPTDFDPHELKKSQKGMIFWVSELSNQGIR